MNFEALWYSFLFTNRFSEKLLVRNTQGLNYISFFIKDIPGYIHYEIAYFDDYFKVSLDCENPSGIILLKDYLLEFSQKNSYILQENYKKVSIYKKVQLLALFEELDFLIKNSIEEIQKVFSTFLEKDLSQNVLNLEFNDIYYKARWKNGSGAGSDPSLLKDYIFYLNNFIKENNIKSIADCGCGDWQYMSHVDLSEVDYIGYDVSKLIIDINRKLFSSEKTHFIHYDGDFEKIQHADLLICKEVLQHLPNSYVFNFIKSIHKYRYVLIGNVVSAKNNVNDISIGQFRFLDITEPPFNLPAKNVLTIPKDSNFIKFYLFENRVCL